MNIIYYLKVEIILYSDFSHIFGVLSESWYSRSQCNFTGQLLLYIYIYIYIYTHIYTQKIHRTTQSTQTIRRTTQLKMSCRLNFLYSYFLFWEHALQSEIHSRLFALLLPSCEFHETFSIKIFSQCIYFSKDDSKIQYQICIVKIVKWNRYFA